MKKLTLADIRSRKDYELVREDFRRHILAVKEPRRIAVGPYLTFLFENRDTMIYQIQEMARVEGIEGNEAIQHEVNTYNELVPGENELRATLLIEFDDATVRRVKLAELVGLEKHVALVVDRDYVVNAVFDDRQIDPGKISSVQYIHFPLGKKAADAFMTTDYVEIVTSHPACSYRLSLSREQLAALRSDLSSPG
jgi:hypothetical protein